MERELTNTIQVYEAVWVALVVIGIVSSAYLVRRSFRLVKHTYRTEEPPSVVVAAEGLLIREIIRLCVQFCFIIPGYQAVTRPYHGPLDRDGWLFVTAIIGAEVLIVSNSVIDAIWNKRIIDKRRAEFRLLMTEGVER